MADVMQIVITARKEVPDRDQARIIFDLVKARLADRPDIILAGHCTNHFESEPEQPG